MGSNNTIYKNLIFLSGVQVLNYLVPLLIIPILINRIGLKAYGIVALSQGIMFLFTAISDYGMSITGTRAISQASNSNIKRNICLLIFQSKFFLLPVCFIGLIILTFTIPVWREKYPIILSSFALVIGTTLLPNWYFLGVGKTRHLALLTFLSRTVYFLCILFFVKDSRDTLLVNCFNGSGNFIAATLGVYIIHKDISLLKHRLFKPSEIFSFLKDNTAIFLSNLVQSAYRSSGILLAGFFLSPGALGLYGIIDKVLMMTLNGFIVVFNSVFPKVCELAKQSHHKLRNFYRFFFPRLASAVLFGSVMIYLVGPDMLATLLEDFNTMAIEPYILLIAIFPILILMNFPISLTLTARNKGRAFFYYNLSALISMLALGIPLGFYEKIYGLMMSILITEVITFAIGMVLINKRLGLQRITF